MWHKSRLLRHKSRLLCHRSRLLCRKMRFWCHKIRFLWHKCRAFVPREATLVAQAGGTRVDSCATKVREAMMPRLRFRTNMQRTKTAFQFLPRDTLKHLFPEDVLLRRLTVHFWRGGAFYRCSSSTLLLPVCWQQEAGTVPRASYWHQPSNTGFRHLYCVLLLRKGMRPC